MDEEEIAALVEARVANEVARVISEREAARVAEEQARTVAIAQAVEEALSARDAAERERLAAAEAARSTELIDRALAGLVAAVDAASAIEGERQAALGQMLAGLGEAVDKAIELERVAYARRSIKVAMFDADGRYCGWAHHRADLLDRQAADPITRLAWRDEWDDLGTVEILLPDGRGTGVHRLAIPDLADIPGGLEEAASQCFADYPTPDLT